VADGWLTLAVRYFFMQRASDTWPQFNHKGIRSALLLFVLSCGTSEP
jgi:hypothetical protein